ALAFCCTGSPGTTFACSSSPGRFVAVRARLLPLLLESGIDEQVLPMNAARRGYRSTVAQDAATRRQHRPAAIERVQRVAMRWRLLLARPGLLLPVINPLWLRYFSHIVLRLLAPLF